MIPTEPWATTAGRNGIEVHDDSSATAPARRSL